MKIKWLWKRQQVFISPHRSSWDSGKAWWNALQWAQECWSLELSAQWHANLPCWVVKPYTGGRWNSSKSPDKHTEQKMSSSYLSLRLPRCARSTCPGRAGLSYLFRPWVRFFWVWSQQTSQEMSTQKSKAVQDSVAAVTPESHGVGSCLIRPLLCVWCRLLVIRVFLDAGWLSAMTFAVNLNSSCSNRNGLSSHGHFTE
jgi:hypothetical protein